MAISVNGISDPEGRFAEETINKEAREGGRYQADFLRERNSRRA